MDAYAHRTDRADPEMKRDFRPCADRGVPVKTFNKSKPVNK